MNPDRILPTIPTTASVDRIVHEFLDLDLQEERALRDLQILQDANEATRHRLNQEIQELEDSWQAQEDIHQRLSEIGQQRAQWNICLRREEERVRTESFDIWRAKEKWEAEQSDWIKAQVEQGVARHIEALWDKNHLVGYFVQVIGGGQGRGVVRERVTRDTFNILYSDGYSHTLDIRFFNLVPPTDAEREVFGKLGFIISSPVT
jgi:hypothetical protein